MRGDDPRTDLAAGCRVRSEVDCRRFVSRDSDIRRSKRNCVVLEAAFEHGVTWLLWKRRHLPTEEVTHGVFVFDVGESPNRRCTEEDPRRVEADELLLRLAGAPHPGPADDALATAYEDKRAQTRRFCPLRTQPSVHWVSIARHQAGRVKETPFLNECGPKEAGDGLDRLLCAACRASSCPCS